MSTVQIEGVQYQSYQAPGDPFRFVCPVPCAAAPQLIYAQYSGFKQARGTLLQIMGVDTLPELQPVDVHVSNDPKCGKLKDAPALSFAFHNANGNAYICTFIFEYSQGYNGQPYSPELAVRLDQQTILIHEYLHTIFFGRVASEAGSMHDFVTPISPYVTDMLGTGDLCAYHPQSPPGDYGGWLIFELCRQNGFRIEKLAPAMVALDQLYQSGGGQVQEGYQHPVPTMGQFRQILNQALGSDTSKAFADSCWPAKLFGDSYTLSNACLYPTPTVQPTAVK
jgi:hypothetical protein